MKTAVEMINEVTKFGAVALTRDSLSELLKAYAQSAIDEIKEKIAEEAKVSLMKHGKDSWVELDKESIRSVTIELK